MWAFFTDFDRMDQLTSRLRLADGPHATESVEGKGQIALPTIRYFGDYELLEEIARGGMGVVYKARQVSLNRIVALKMILAGMFASAREVQRFRSEAEAAANLDHPHIVPLFEVGEYAGQQYFSMKFVEGDSLASHPHGDPRVEVVGLIDVIHAVHHAHQHGILHRDLKPSNVLIDSQGKWYATDFGLAKQLTGKNSSLTDTGQVLGTARYMAPEQAAGQKGLTVSADVYSLGVILYERLTGHTPFTGDDVLTILRQVRETEPPRPSSIRPGLDRDLETITLKCLAKGVAERYDSASALAEDLQRWLAGEPILARRASAWERARKWARRRPTAATLVGVSVLAGLMLIGLAVAANYNGLLRAALMAEADQRAEAQRQRVWVEERERDTRRYWYAADIGLAGRYWSAGRRARAVELLERHVTAPQSDDIRGFEWHYLWRLCHLDRGRLSTLGEKESGPYVGLAFPPGRATLFVGHSTPILSDSPFQHGRIAEWDPASGRRLQAPLTSTTLESVCLGTQGFATLDDAGLWAGEFSAGRVRHVRDRGDLDKILTLAPDGKTAILYATRDNPPGMMRLIVLDLETGREVGSYPVGHAWPRPVAISPDGKTLALAMDGLGEGGLTGNASDGWPITLRDLKTGHPIGRFLPGIKFVRCLAFAADGKTLIVGGADWNGPSRGGVRKEGEIELWDLTGPGPKRASRLAGHEGGTRCLAVSSDSETLASGGDDRLVKLWRLSAVEGRNYSGRVGEQRVAFRGHETSVVALAFSPDSRSIASCDEAGTTLTWDSLMEPESQPLVEQPHSIIEVAFTADGRTVLSADASGVSSFDAATGRGTGRFETGRSLKRERFAFSPDGKILAQTELSDGKVLLWDIAGHKEIGQLPFEGERRVVDGMNFSPDGRELALGSTPTRPSDASVPWIQLWDLTSLRPRLRLDGATSPMAYSPTGQFLATASHDRHSIQIRDASRGHVILTWHDPEDRDFGRLVFSPDGTLLAAGSRNGRGVLLWDVAKSWMVRTLPSGGAFALAFSPGGLTLATADGANLVLWQVSTGQELLTLVGHTCDLNTASFSPDGSLLASGGGWREENDGVRLWRVQHGASPR